MFKPNTMLPIYDYKQNKVYMVNVTTRRFYFQPKQFKSASTAATIVGSAITGGILYRIVQQQGSQLYLNQLSQTFKASLVAIGIVIGVVLFLWPVKNSIFLKSACGLFAAFASEEASGGLSSGRTAM